MELYLILISIITIVGSLGYRSVQTDLVYQYDKISDLEYRLKRLERKVDEIARHLNIES